MRDDLRSIERGADALDRAIRRASDVSLDVGAFSTPYRSILTSRHRSCHGRRSSMTRRCQLNGVSLSKETIATHVREAVAQAACYQRISFGDTTVP